MAKKLKMSLTLGAAITLLAASLSAFAGPGEKTYEVTVYTSFGTQFTDCMRFDAGGTFTLDQLGPGFWFDVDPTVNSFLAWASDGAITVGFFGFTYNTDFRIIAFGRNPDTADTFLAFGPENANCTIFAKSDGYSR